MAPKRPAQRPPRSKDSARKKNRPRKEAPAKHGGRNTEKDRIASLGTEGAPGFPIVGIGASAGGLEAFEQFFKNVPPDSGAAFVLVSHLDPGHKSLMAGLMKKFTSVEAKEIEDGMKVGPEKIYTIPPNKDLAIKDGRFRLSAPGETRGARMPIDFFFRSLAGDQGDKTIGIILSGTGTDGTLGLREIHGVGGLTMVQQPETAKYDGMPRSAIQTGMVDHVLPADKMAEYILDYLKRAPSRKPPDTILAGETPSSLNKIISIIRSQTGHDFSLYKKNTLHRRIERRMNLHQIEEVRHYIPFLHNNPEEVRLLFKELLIGVTSFFRDPEAFKVMKQKILPAIFEGKSEEYIVRVWAPGCATGEEAFSIAMVIQEFLEEGRKNHKMQVFGTDIDEKAIEQARRGIFPTNIAIDVGSERLKRFFNNEEIGLRIRKEIRDSVVFAVQNVIKDAPFTKMDLISCRNLLIYLEPELQNKLIPLFHYSLKPMGFLFLGSSETIGRFSGHFSLVDQKWKFFRSKVTAPSAHEVAQTGLPWTFEHLRGKTGEEKKVKELNVPEALQKTILAEFSFPAAVIDDKGMILYIHGDTGRYLRPAPGQANMNIQDMAREGIRLELRAGIHQALSRKKEIVYESLRVKTNGGFAPLRILIRPLGQPDSEPGLLIVVFQEFPLPKKEEGKVKEKKSTRISLRLKQLEDELAYTKESLHASMEEMQASNEELKSTNEELQSTNEELQSTNEELETSKEELQSVNEELNTVNSELQSKIEMLSQAETDMRHLLNSTNIATLFLDQDLKISRYTPKLTDLINLIPADVGRPVGHLVTNLNYDGLLADAQEVLQTLAPKELEVESKSRKQYILRIMPYRTTDNVIEGVVMTFSDITEIYKSRREFRETVAELQAARDFSESVIATMREPLLVLNSDLTVVSANRAFYEFFRVDPGETSGKFVYDLGNGQWDIPRLRELLEEILPKDTRLDDFEVSHQFPAIGPKVLRLNARKIAHSSDSSSMILLAFEDMTDRLPLIKSSFREKEKGQDH